ncbi:hypothetical protein ACJIZ3_008167 [Penstemon smallii]|uniref:Nuclear matrix constituent protein 1-like protein n=1 Tax=Penstemon smallii TaxID=265156 RepID=A0ABD3T9Z9_9LAMI
MFSPQKLWSLTPRSEPGQINGSVSGQGSGLNPNSRSPRNGNTLATGKAVAFLESDGPMDQTSLTQRVLKLENELFEYQYNMGLLLIEKKEWNLKYEELKQALADTTDNLKREEIAHSSVVSELEKREENLKKALGVERQCVLDLEKSLREMRAEHAEIKFNADSKLAEANAIATSVEEKSLEVEAKLHAADAKLAEASRKSSEIERKLQELEAQENALRRERSFFTKERKAQDSTISEQKEDLREWDRKLQEAEGRLADGRRLLTEREEKANDNDKMLKQKQNDLEELRKKIEITNSTLKNKEDDISSRLATVALKEKEVDEVRKSLEEKEKRLLELEENLNDRERLGIQKLLDEHNSILAEKQQEFELELDEKRKLHDEQLKNKEVEVDKREVEVSHMEEKIGKREQAIEKKVQKLKEKEMDLDSKSKALKEKQKSLKVEENSLENDKKQLLAEKEELLNIRAELENLRAETEEQLQRLNEEREQLKVTEDERLEFARLQSELKQEIDKYRFQSEQLVKETDNLKQEKEKFEKQWEELDDKRVDIKKEQDEVLEQKKHFEKVRQSEEEKLNNEKMKTQEYVQSELEALKLAKESFAASMEYEKSILAEKSQSEKIQLLNDFELRKQELETQMQKRQEEMESRLLERENSFAKEKEAELNNINFLREVARREMEEMKMERRVIEKEKLDISQNKKHVEEQQFEMKKDIEELIGLSKKLNDQREQFIKERERFIAFAENQKSCNTCGEKIRDFMLSDLQPSAELDDLEAPPLPKIAENYLKEAVEGTSEKFNDEASPVGFNSGSPAGGTMSWLRKCTSKIFIFSAGKKLELDDAALDQTEASAPKTSLSHENESEPSLRVANDSLDFQIIESDSGIREVDGVQALSVDQGTLNIPPEDSQNSDLGTRRNGPSKRGRARVGRTRSVKSGAKSNTGPSLGENGNQYANGVAENSAHTNEESKGESALLGATKNIRKRNHNNLSQANVSENQSEGQSGSVQDSGRPKRRQRVAAAEPNIYQKRYNLRKPRKPVATEANGSLPEDRKGKEKEDQLSNLGANSRKGTQEPVTSTGAASAFSADSPVRFKNAETVNTSVDNIVMSEEVNESAGLEYIDEDFKTESNGEEENDSDNDDEVDHPGEVSVGKKLWTFFTT